MSAYDIHPDFTNAIKLIEKPSAALSQSPPPTERNRRLIQSAEDFLQAQRQGSSRAG